MLSLINIADPRQVIVIGLTETTPGDAERLIQITSTSGRAIRSTT